MFVNELGRELKKNELAIWEGTANMPTEKMEAYRVKWRAEAAQRKGGEAVTPEPFPTAREIGGPRNIGERKPCNCGSPPTN